MLIFLIAITIVGIPAILIMWWKKFYPGILLGGLIFLYAFIWFLFQANWGAIGWIGDFEGYLATVPNYGVRWKIPVFLDLLLQFLPFITARWLLWLFIASALWWFGLILFYLILRRLEYSMLEATIMALIPLLTMGGIRFAMISADCLFWIVIVLGFFTIQLFFINGIQKGIRDWRVWLLATVTVSLGVFVLWLVPPIPPGYQTLLEWLTNPLEFLVGLHIWWVLIIEGILVIRKDIPKTIKYSLVLVPLFAVMIIYGSDWQRWATLAAPVWVLFVIIGLRKWFLRLSDNETIK